MHLLFLFYGKWLMGAGGKLQEAKIPRASLGATMAALDFNLDLTISFPGRPWAIHSPFQCLSLPICPMLVSIVPKGPT